jgi:hypothetical protein
VRESRGRICLVTTGQPATNPRLVKEADALSAAGCEVHVVGALPAVGVDAEPAMMAGRRWTLDVVDWRRETSPWLFWQSRLRQQLALRVIARLGRAGWLAESAITRPSRELAARACGHQADLYIAHNLGALPAAARAARRHGARLGFDAEDFHSGQFPVSMDDGWGRATAAVERRFLPACDYVTAAAPGSPRRTLVDTTGRRPHHRVERRVARRATGCAPRPTRRRSASAVLVLTDHWPATRARRRRAGSPPRAVASAPRRP